MDPDDNIGTLRYLGDVNVDGLCWQLPFINSVHTPNKPREQ